MFSLPSLAPQDSYSLWYTSSTTPTPSTSSLQTSQSAPHDHATTHQPSRRHLPAHRTPLSRLRHDEEYMERRKLNIQNYGSGWIKPPGIQKSLHQQREERREMEEHQEALRREQLAQELAEAEAADGIDEMLQGEGMEGEMEEVRDLDDDVPDADADATRLLDSDSEGSEEGDENDVEEVPRNVLASRLPDDMYRDALIRGDEARQSGFRDEDSGDDEDEEGEDLLQEEDLIHEHVQEEQHDLDMNMDGDLDDEIPEASADGYEHTDTEEELTSSEEESADEGHLPQRAAASSMVRSDGTQNSMDLSNLMSGSSQVGSSPRRSSRFLRGTGRSS
ncbi:uncharacterized protein RSE6_02031 [Rhynchosporium secalis]|uniref:Anaphase-promoting complex, subunit 15/MND2 n=1 Tax=Rhynchosporium secalis TaxID=38038 RepID=A0A1E1LZ97_RHYSE|nr:uncharacterized protein RSE6_02031 [Rhynchosporium secalis]